MKLITFLKRSLTRPARSQEEYASYCDDLRPMLGCDYSGRVILCNQAAELLMGQVAADVLGKPLDDFLRTSMHHHGGWLTTKEGSPKAVKVNVGSSKDNGNQIVGYRYIIWPISTGGNGTEHLSE